MLSKKQVNVENKNIVFALTSKTNGTETRELPTI